MAAWASRLACRVARWRPGRSVEPPPERTLRIPARDIYRDGTRRLGTLTVTGEGVHFEPAPGERWLGPPHVRIPADEVAELLVEPRSPRRLRTPLVRRSIRVTTSDGDVHRFVVAQGRRAAAHLQAILDGEQDDAVVARFERSMVDDPFNSVLRCRVAAIVLILLASFLETFGAGAFGRLVGVPAVLLIVGVLVRLWWRRRRTAHA